MDSARGRRRISSPPQLPPTAFSSQPTSDVFDVGHGSDLFDPTASPTRRQKLLHNRNIHFPGKKLSLSGISNKFNQLIGKDEQPGRDNEPSRDQENNKLHKSKSTGAIGKRVNRGTLDGYDYARKSQSLRQREEVPIYQDHQENTAQSSPFTSSPYIDPRGEFHSPLGFDLVHDNLNEMRLRELSLNVDWSPVVKSPPYRSKSKKRPVPVAFDTDDYIEHIEKELQQTRDEAYSPLTRRPVREKLKAATKENDRLQKELAQLRDKFETELKQTVEHKTLAELEMRRKVRDLEELLQDKDHTIRELQYQHEERRLDNNTIASLKATIERLEQDKTDMEQINLSMSKRNEVLTQLLAMSPPKLSDGFQLRSPVREKRNARPISLILPRNPASPTSTNCANLISTADSSRGLDSADISPFRLSPDQDSVSLPSLSQNGVKTPQEELTDPMRRSPSPYHGTRSRRSTLHSDISASTASNTGTGVSLNEDRGHNRRKARRFMAGSTQLKPLLLPSLTGEGVNLLSASTASSPWSLKARTLSDVDMDDTILANQDVLDVTHDHSIHPETAEESPTENCGAIENGPGPAYNVHHPAGFSSIQSPRRPDLAYSHSGKIAAIGLSTTTLQPETERTRGRSVELSVEHLKLHDSQYSLHAMPIPETPESLIGRPQPLFSLYRDVAPRTNRMLSISPYVSSGTWQVSIQKKRKNSLGTLDLCAPAMKLHCSHQLRQTGAGMATNQVPCSPTAFSSTTSASKRLSQIRNTDNFVDFIRQMNFAAKPLAALTIRTIYTVLSTCTSTVRDFRKDPFALARRVLANAWRANWKVFGKVSWWVLGLFIQPQTRSKARAPIDWDQYDGESIASRYCSSVSQGSESEDAPLVKVEQVHSDKAQNDEPDQHNAATAATTGKKVGWGKSMFLWGKFSAALMLAIGGAVVKGPSEMLKETNTDRPHQRRHSKACKQGKTQNQHNGGDACHGISPQTLDHDRRKAASTQAAVSRSPYSSEFEFRYQLESSSLLDELQQPNCDYDSTLRPETAARGRVSSLFSPTSLTVELATRLQDLRLCSTDLTSDTPHLYQAKHHSVREEG